MESCTPCQEQEREKKEASDLPMEKSEAVVCSFDC